MEMNFFFFATETRRNERHPVSTHTER